MSKQTIWNYLKTHTDLPDVSIAGIMGNMEAESNCESCRLQGDFTATRQKSKDYANALDHGFKSFEAASVDQYGWGLAQWTYPQRKLNLFKSCRSQEKSVGDEEAQLAFMLAEMQNEFTSMWHQLLVADSINTAAYLVCHFYERPAVENIPARTDYGETIYKQFHGKDIQPEPEPAPADDKTDKIIALLEQILALLKEG